MKADTMVTAYVLITNPGVHSAWTEFLREAITPLGQLEIMDVSKIREKTMNRMNKETNDVLIVDSTTVENVVETVSQLRNERPERRIVVTTATPTWQGARAAFEAGAIDYVPMFVCKSEEMANTMEEISRKPLPPWPR